MTRSTSSFLRQPLAVVPILLLVLLATPWHSSFGQDEDVNRVLQNMLARVEVTPPGYERHERIERANEMLRYVERKKKSVIAAIDDQTIDRIAKLLLDPDDFIKSRAANLLGKLGARSQRTLPALRRALSKTESQLQEREAEEFLMIFRAGDPLFSTKVAIFLIENPEKSLLDYGEYEKKKSEGQLQIRILTDQDCGKIRTEHCEQTKPPQIPERLIYDDKKYRLHAEPLTEYFMKYPEKWPEGAFDILNLRRRYVATFEIINNELFLKDIEIMAGMNETRAGFMWKWESVLPEFLAGQAAPKIDWFSGILIVPYGETIEHIYMGFRSIYENYILIEIKNGDFIKETRMDHLEYKKFRDEQFEKYKKTKGYKKRLSRAQQKHGDMFIEKDFEDQIKEFEYYFISQPLKE